MQNRALRLFLSPVRRWFVCALAHMRPGIFLYLVDIKL